jgi:hypothetical protein
MNFRKIGAFFATMLLIALTFAPFVSIPIARAVVYPTNFYSDFSYSLPAGVGTRAIFGDLSLDYIKIPTQNDAMWTQINANNHEAGGYDYCIEAGLIRYKYQWVTVSRFFYSYFCSNDSVKHTVFTNIDVNNGYYRIDINRWITVGGQYDLWEVRLNHNHIASFRVPLDWYAKRFTSELESTWNPSQGGNPLVIQRDKMLYYLPIGQSTFVAIDGYLQNFGFTQLLPSKDGLNVWHSQFGYS